MNRRKFLEKLKIALSAFLFFIAIHSQAQKAEISATDTAQINSKSDSVTSSGTNSGWLPTTSVYLELGGKVFYSLNVDFRRPENFAFSVSASYVTEDSDTDTESQSVLFSSLMGYYFTGKRHRLEMGCGLCPGFSSKDGLSAMSVYRDFRYRYQKKRSLIFREAFTPFVPIISKDDKITLMPWAAISLGYSF